MEIIKFQLLFVSFDTDIAQNNLDLDIIVNKCNLSYHCKRVSYINNSTIKLVLESKFNGFSIQFTQKTLRLKLNKLQIEDIKIRKKLKHEGKPYTDSYEWEKVHKWLIEQNAVIQEQLQFEEGKELQPTRSDFSLSEKLKELQSESYNKGADSIKDNFKLIKDELNCIKNIVLSIKDNLKPISLKREDELNCIKDIVLNKEDNLKTSANFVPKRTAVSNAKKKNTQNETSNPEKKKELPMFSQEKTLRLAREQGFSWRDYCRKSNFNKKTAEQKQFLKEYWHSL